MKDLFVSYEIALKLKELGFDEPCIATYHTKTKEIIKIYGEYKKQPLTTDSFNNFWILVPLYQQVIDWFYKQHKLHLDVTFREVEGKKIEGINSVYFDIEIYKIYGGDAYKVYKFNQCSDDPKYCWDVAIKQAIEIVENEKNSN